MCMAWNAISRAQERFQSPECVAAIIAAAIEMDPAADEDMPGSWNSALSECDVF